MKSSPVLARAVRVLRADRHHVAGRRPGCRASTCRTPRSRPRRRRRCPCATRPRSRRSAGRAGSPACRRCRTRGSAPGCCGRRRARAARPSRLRRSPATRRWRRRTRPTFTLTTREPGAMPTNCVLDACLRSLHVARGAGVAAGDDARHRGAVPVGVEARQCRGRTRRATGRGRSRSGRRARSPARHRCRSRRRRCRRH